MTPICNTESLLAAKLQAFTIGRWHVRSLPYYLQVTEAEQAVLSTLAKKWSGHFTPKHSNWMTKSFHVPSIIIRFDYALDEKGDVHVFEIEDRPAGLEISALNNETTFNAFISALNAVGEYAGKSIGVCLSKGRMFNSDDFFWLQRLSNPDKYRVVLGEIPRKPDDSLWIVRSLRTEEEYFQLSPFSLSTIQYEGDKSYGVSMGLWKELSQEDTNMQWDTPFVLKPEAGCRCENVHLYHPRKPSGGYSSRKKVEMAILNKEVRYIQQYQAPEQPHFLPERYAMIRRCYLVFDIVSNAYKVIGGQWEARPGCHKIHGAGDAICGPLVL